MPLNDLTPGQRAELRDLTITVTAHSRKGFTLLANKDGDRLLYTQLAGADVPAVGFFSPNITVTPEGAWRFELLPVGHAVKAELIVADELDRKDYQFNLPLR